MDFIVKQVQGGTWDIFTEIGWENWTRVHVSRERCYVVNGKRIPVSILKAVHKHITGK